MDWTCPHHGKAIQNREEHKHNERPVPGTNMSYVQKGTTVVDETLSADRRVQRTRLALRDALISLLIERGWDEITIQDLCERANVGRSTFYLHFQNKEQLLVDGLDDLRTWLRSQTAGSTHHASASLPFVRGLIEHVAQQRILFRALIGRGSGHVVQKRFREMVTQLVEEHVCLPASGWKQAAGARYVAGALVELLAWWVDAGNKRSADEIEHLFYQLAAPTITQLGAGN
jgi:AcrR family transcriptional regulator